MPPDPKPPISHGQLPIILGQDNAYYGRELFIVDGKDELHTQAERHVLMHNERLGRTSWVLELGGASGERAEAFRDAGAHVLVVDICNFSEEILKRNMTSGVRAIDFVQADIGELNITELPSHPWTLISAINVLYWMPWKKTKNLLENLPRIATTETCLAMSFAPSLFGERGERKGERTVDGYTRRWYLYHWDDVLDLLKQSGYEILWSNRDSELRNRGNGLIFAKVPGIHPTG